MRLRQVGFCFSALMLTTSLSASLLCSSFLNSSTQYSRFGVLQNVIDELGLELSSEGVLTPVKGPTSFVSISIKGLMSLGIPVIINPYLAEDNDGVFFPNPYSRRIELNNRLFDGTHKKYGNSFRILSILRHERTHLIKVFRAEGNMRDSHSELVKALSDDISVKFISHNHGEMARLVELLPEGYRKQFIVNEVEAFLAGILMVPSQETRKVRVSVAQRSFSYLKIAETFIRVQNEIFTELINMNPERIRFFRTDPFADRDIYAVTMRDGAEIRLGISIGGNWETDEKYEKDPIGFLLEIASTRLETLSLIKRKLPQLRYDLEKSNR